MTTWSISYAHLRSTSKFLDLNGTSDEMIERVKNLAHDQVWSWEVEDYTDQVDFFFRDSKGKRRRFLTLMREG